MPASTQPTPSAGAAPVVPPGSTPNSSPQSTPPAGQTQTFKRPPMNADKSPRWSPPPPSMESLIPGTNIPDQGGSEQEVSGRWGSGLPNDMPHAFPPMEIHPSVHIDPNMRVPEGPPG